MMNKYGVSNICPECNHEGLIDHMIKLGNGTIQEQSTCPVCRYETVRIVTEENADDSPPDSTSD